MCGRFRPDEGAVAGYGNRIRVKSPAKWGVQIAGMIFQTHSSNVLQDILGSITSEQLRSIPRSAERNQCVIIKFPDRIKIKN
ncbi:MULTISPECIES: DUF6783 domain-containing protein [unclassified Ruminococcus]|uniref:DUF6783 domain-containing protein n=1 Tax=unclassified Ruminococcus TaxID=2608920 RepID=UPI00319EA63C